MSKLLLALLVALPLQSIGAQDPAANPDTIPLGEIQHAPVSRLLAHMPKDVWNRDGAKWTLKPVPLELQRRVEGESLSDADWHALLESQDVIHMRTRWPAGEPLGVWIRQPVWLRLGRITAQAVQPGLGSVVNDNLYPSWCGNCAADDAMSMRRLTFDTLSRDTERVRLQITIEQRGEPEKSSLFAGEPRELWRGMLELPVAACASVDEVLPPTSTPEQTKTLIDSLRAYRSGEDGEMDRPLMLVAGGENVRLPALRGVGVSLEFELLHGDEVVGYADLIADQGEGFGDTKRGLHGYCYLFHFPLELDAPGSDLSGWALRVRGRSDGLLPVWEVDSWWNGTAVIPMSQVLANRE